MKLFKLQITTTRGRAYDVLAHAETPGQAESLVQSKFVGCQIGRPLELPDVPKHFVLAELEPE